MSYFDNISRMREGFRQRPRDSRAAGAGERRRSPWFAAARQVTFRRSALSNGDVA